ncbi:hypothetical protein MTO96_010418 [Rhipicephalus appendiculatus]
MYAVPSARSVPANFTEESHTTSGVDTRQRQRSKESSVAPSTPSRTTTPPEKTTFFATLRTTVKKLTSQAGSGFLRKLLQADVSSECSLGLLKFTRAIQELEPWALRLVDASAKYPTGFLQVSLADLGAYDECIETVVRDEVGIVQVRGQYCDVQLKLGDDLSVVPQVLQAMAFSHEKIEKYQSIVTEPSAPGVRLGLCFIDACNERDVENMARALAGNVAKVSVKNCVTNEPEKMDRTQVCIIGFLIYHSLNKEKRNRIIVLGIALVRRLIRAPMVHLWYLSVDYQLCIVAILVIQTFKTATLDTGRYYYNLPFYHAVCFFSGCISFFLVQEYGEAKISKVMQALLWCVALFSGLCCLFLKLEWERNGEWATETKRMIVAFSDRILWSICISWFSFACITGRGGFVNKFLSWSAFVPLSQLTFGVYLIHMPFYNLMRRITRERRHYSHFNRVNDCFVVLIWSYMLSYVLFIACEAPTGHLDKIAFVRGGRRHSAKIPATEDSMQNTSDRRSTKDFQCISIEDRTMEACLNKNDPSQGTEHCSSRL